MHVLTPNLTDQDAEAYAQAAVRSMVAGIRDHLKRLDAEERSLLNEMVTAAHWAEQQGMVLPPDIDEAFRALAARQEGFVE